MILKHKPWRKADVAVLGKALELNVSAMTAPNSSEYTHAILVHNLTILWCRTGKDVLECQATSSFLPLDDYTSSRVLRLSAAVPSAIA